MTEEEFSRLLYESESVYLDFKRDPYPFCNATDDQKSELLKDLLGFANAGKHADSFILLGVKEVKGGKAEVVGIDEHLDDHSLQQFVRSKVNRELKFSYEAVSVEGKQVGVLRIPQQTRPVFLEQDYGRLKKYLVYIRRGSSTDPSKYASHDEIAEMRAPHFELAFGDAADDHYLGDSVMLDLTRVSAPADNEIPRYQDSDSGFYLGSRWVPTPQILDPFNRKNPDYYREMSRALVFYWSHKQVRVIATNTSIVAAEQVLVCAELPPDAQLQFASRGIVPDEPSQRQCEMIHRATRGLARLPQPGDVEVTTTAAGTTLKIEFGLIQPGRSMWSEPFWIGASRSGTHSFEAKFFAANLPKPQELTLNIEATVTPRVLSVDEICRLAKQFESPGESDGDA